MSAPAQPVRQQAEVSPGVLAAIRVLLSAVLIVDAYLAWASLRAGTVAGCGPESSCHTVLNSQWAYWFGVPVSLLGLIVYAGLLGATLFLSRKTVPVQRRKAWQILIPCSVMALGAGLWFVGIQIVVLRTLCPYCMTAHVCGMAAAGLLLLGAPIRKGPEKAKQRAQQVFVTPPLARRLGFGALASLGVLAAGQMLQKPRSPASQLIAAGLVTNGSPAAAGEAPQAASHAPPRRQFQIFEGQFTFDLNEVPLIGRPEAPYTMVSLFDYTCHHCRDMHKPIVEAQERFSNELAVINLPMPLDSQCNPVIKRTQAAHVNACALARLGLTVWLANRQAAPQFDDWMFASANPPEPAEAERQARELVGAAAFEKAATNAWIDRQIRQDVALFEAIYRRYNKGFMPQIIVGTNLISGASNRDQLFQLLSDQFGLKAENNPR